MNQNERLLARRSAVAPPVIPRVTTATVATIQDAILCGLEGNELSESPSRMRAMRAMRAGRQYVQRIWPAPVSDRRRLRMVLPMGSCIIADLNQASVHRGGSIVIRRAFACEDF